eukprot:9346233-Karenia_brevis.AAC.1
MHPDVCKLILDNTPPESNTSGLATSVLLQHYAILSALALAPTLTLYPISTQCKIVQYQFNIYHLSSPSGLSYPAPTASPKLTASLF